MQQWFALSAPAMEEALHDMPVFCEFAGLEGWDEGCPTRARFCGSGMYWRNTIWRHKSFRPSANCSAPRGRMLKNGTVVDGTLIAAPNSTKNSSGERDPEMKQSRKGQQWYFGMKCHADSGLVHTVRDTSGAVNDVIEANSLVRASDRDVYVDAGYQGAGQRPDARRVLAQRNLLRSCRYLSGCPHVQRLMHALVVVEMDPVRDHPAGVMQRFNFGSRSPAPSSSSQCGPPLHWEETLRDVHVESR